MSKRLIILILLLMHAVSAKAQTVYDDANDIPDIKRSIQGNIDETQFRAKMQTEELRREMQANQDTLAKSSNKNNADMLERIKLLEMRVLTSERGIDTAMSLINKMQDQMKKEDDIIFDLKATIAKLELQNAPKETEDHFSPR